MADRPVFLYAAVYDDIPTAEGDYEAVFDLHAAGVIGTFDSAVIEKEGGEVRVHKTEKPTQHGAWTGIAVGAVAGILFPPSIIGGAIVGGAAGGVAGHLWRGMSRSDLKELGEALDEGEAAVIVIGESRIDEQIEKATKQASDAAGAPPGRGQPSLGWTCQSSLHGARSAMVLASSEQVGLARKGPGTL